MRSRWPEKIGKQALFLSAAMILGGFGPTPVARPPDLSSQILTDPLLQRLLSQFSGVIRVSVAGESVFHLSRAPQFRIDGVAAPEPSQDSLFPIASLTKQFMAALVLKRVQEGELSFETPISAILPGLPSHWREIRVVHLLTHSSGIADHLSDALIERFRSGKQSPGEIFDALQGIPLRAQPGVRPPRPAQRINSSAGGFYSNGNFLALALILEELSRRKAGRSKTWPQLLEDEILIPAGLKRTGVLEGSALGQSLLPGFVRVARGPAVAPMLRAPVLYGCGDLISSAEDLARWNHQLFETDSVLKAPYRNLMLEAISGDYSAGGRVGGVGHELFFLRTGTLRGYQHASTYFPHARMAIVVLSQQEGSPVKALTQRLADLIRRIFLARPRSSAV